VSAAGGPSPAGEREPSGAAAPAQVPPGGGPDRPVTPAMPLWRRGPWIAAALLSAVLLTAVVTWNVRGAVDSPGPAAEESAEPREPAPDDDRMLFSAECADVIAFGQHDDCVRELQELLAGHGARIGIDGQFGPETLRRVQAFQVLAGLEADGMVGDATKEALYSADVSLATWTPEQVTERIREVFTEEPDLAVRIADCQSFLDPLHILGNTDGSRNWGVFQISDARLRDLRATPEEALDPEWNIEAAYRLWAQNEDFSHWPHCLAAAQEPDEE
ncbi:peptidoglycan-binding protein, partial [Streptomyces sp. YIM 98790]|uniref:peptidoglycan-binding domain-containing protein n=1 Tax=Streptomyces sp. YIM 98790 TaxID=2689077 RepID=UPI001A9E577E